MWLKYLHFLKDKVSKLGKWERWERNESIMSKKAIFLKKLSPNKLFSQIKWYKKAKFIKISSKNLKNIVSNLKIEDRKVLI